MAKVAVMSDIHLGVRQNSKVFLDHFLDFLDTTVIPTCKKNDVQELVIAGDLFDHRKLQNVELLHTLREVKQFYAKLVDTFHSIHILPGNHDIYHTNTLRVNSLEECIPAYCLNNRFNDGPIQLYMEPTAVNLSGLKVLMVPWICEENEKDVLQSIADNSSVCSHIIGHFHLRGYSLGHGQVAEDGHNDDLFSAYRSVGSGHFHTLSEKRVGNCLVQYLGCPYEMTWADWNDPKGFHLLDTETGLYEFHRNPRSLFHKIDWSEYAGGCWERKKVDHETIEKFRGSYCRVMVTEPTKGLDLFLTELEKVALDVKRVDKAISSDVSSDDSAIAASLDFDDAWPFLKKALDEGEPQVPKERLEKFLADVYKEAMLREV
jgi:Straboviridae/Ackermannviridae/Kyanoviridae exonuclease subunit 1